MELQAVANFPLEYLSPVGFIGIAIIANVFPAIPEEVFLLSFGYFANIHPSTFPFFEISLFLIIGFLAVDSVLYYLARRGNKFIDYVLKKLNINIVTNEEYLRKHIGKIIFISRFLAQLRFIGPVAAGKIKHPYKDFLMLDFLALTIYTPAVMGIGYYFADRVEKILSGAKVMNNIMLGVIMLLVVIFLMMRLRKFLKNEAF